MIGNTWGAERDGQRPFYIYITSSSGLRGTIQRTSQHCQLGYIDYLVWLSCKQYLLYINKILVCSVFCSMTIMNQQHVQVKVGLACILSAYVDVSRLLLQAKRVRNFPFLAVIIKSACFLQQSTYTYTYARLLETRGQGSICAAIQPYILMPYKNVDCLFLTRTSREKGGMRVTYTTQSIDLPVYVHVRIVYYMPVHNKPHKLRRQRERERER